jgi:hypothetical protein
MLNLFQHPHVLGIRQIFTATRAENRLQTKQVTLYDEMPKQVRHDDLGL